MARSRKLEPKASEMIYKKMYDLGEMEREELIDLIRPHFIFDKPSAERREILQLANRMMARVKDEKGIRTVFACNVDGVHKYVDIDKSKDLPALKSVDNQLTEKRNGLELSCAKASRRRMEVEGQLSLDFEKGAVH